MTTVPGPESPPLVPAGSDREGERRSMGITTLAFKVATRDTGGGLFLIEQTNHAKGGPPRHVHPDQDEWFYAVEGAYLVEVGGHTHRLGPGDSLLAPRNVAHTWAFVGEETGRLLVGFTPAGAMEAFFREVTKAESMPAQDPELWLAHGMRVVGPPLPTE
jgi:quercetin dioxygenase-like cupin family protein